MFGFLTSVRDNTADPLQDVAAVNLFWQSLPKDDPNAARQAVCKALAEPIARVGSSVDRLQAFLALDQHARVLFDALLANDVTRSAQTPSTINQSWQAALELCRSFGRAYGQFLRLMRHNREFEGRRDCQSLVLLRFFRHRKRELLLRLFPEEAPPFSWREVHDAYRLADARGLLRESLPVQRNHPEDAAEATLEREYVHLLVQDLMNGGNFSPGNAAWISHRIPRWCAGLLLAPDKGHIGEHRFVVDPRADTGLVRSNAEAADGCLYLDMAPLLKSIRDEIASLGEARVSPARPWSLGRRRRLRALQKASALCAAEQAVVARRGERTPTALTVEVVMGLRQILREVRNKAEHEVAEVRPADADGEGARATGFGAPAEDAREPCADDAEMPWAGATARWRLTMVDRSHSGCRLHGPALAANPIIPGALIAFREGLTDPWNLAVVRRVKKRLGGRRVEIGVEYVGRSPQSIVVVVAGSDARPEKATETGGLPRVAGLCLPENTEQPFLPMKTLILPPCGLSPGDRLFLRARTSLHTIRLKEPLEERADFTWSPFETFDP